MFNRKPQVIPTTQLGAKIHAEMANVRMKVLVTRCVLIAFFIILAFFFSLFIFIKSNWEDKAIVGVLEGILSYTMYPLVRHYLPAKKEAEAAEKRTGGKDV